MQLLISPKSRIINRVTQMRDLLFTRITRTKQMSQTSNSWEKIRPMSFLDCRPLYKNAGEKLRMVWKSAEPRKMIEESSDQWKDLRGRTHRTIRTTSEGVLIGPLEAPQRAYSSENWKHLRGRTHRAIGSPSEGVLVRKLEAPQRAYSSSHWKDLRGRTHWAFRKTLEGVLIVPLEGPQRAYTSDHWKDLRGRTHLNIGRT